MQSMIATPPDQNPYQATIEDPIAPVPLGARRQLLPVAVGLLVASILHIIGGLYFFVYVYTIAGAPDTDPQVVHTFTIYAMYFGITMLYCLLLISGAFSMLRYGSYLWAVTVCVLALVPMLGPCYFLGIPFGIWGLLTLHRPEVRNSFARL
jgi:hypothetical protein